jgi:hypothetical protein
VGGASGGASVPGAEVQADEWRRASPRRNDRFMVKAGTPPGEIAFRGHARGREAGRRARGRQPGVGSLSTPGKRSSIRRGRGPTQERSASGAKGRSFRGSALLRRCRVGGRARGGNLRRLPGGRADRQTRPTLGRPDPRWADPTHVGRPVGRPDHVGQTRPAPRCTAAPLDSTGGRPDPRCNSHTHSTTHVATRTRTARPALPAGMGVAGRQAGEGPRCPSVSRTPASAVTGDTWRPPPQYWRPPPPNRRRHPSARLTP